MPRLSDFYDPGDALRPLDVLSGRALESVGRLVDLQRLTSEGTNEPHSLETDESFRTRILERLRATGEDFVDQGVDEIIRTSIARTYTIPARLDRIEVNGTISATNPKSLDFEIKVPWDGPIEAHRSRWEMLDDDFCDEEDAA